MKQIEKKSCVLSDTKGGFITEEEVFNICGIIETNGHEIRRANGFSAKGFFPVVSLMSHCCIVNSRQIMMKEAPFPNTCRSTVLIPEGK